ncbi:MAG TPA: hypothetical protein VMT82_05655 [candidate division Zixibacteria bacterium]|nr:hypothetical protein [candidate division Zixibacteria bacterium]
MSEVRNLQCAVCGELLDAFHSHTVCSKQGSILLPRYDILLCESDDFVAVRTSELERPESFENRTARAPKPLPKSHSLGGIIQPY